MPLVGGLIYGTYLGLSLSVLQCESTTIALVYSDSSLARSPLFNSHFPLLL